MSIDVQLESDEIVVGAPIRGRLHGDVPKGTHVRLRARELRGAEFWDQEEGRADVSDDGAFVLPGPMQPSFFGETFSIEWAVLVRMPLKDVEHPVFVTAPIATRDAAVLLPPMTEKAALKSTLVMFGIAVALSLPMLPDIGVGLIMYGLFAGGLAVWPFCGFAARRLTFGPVVFDLTESFPQYKVQFGVRRKAFIRRVFIRLLCVEWIPNRKRQWVPRVLRRVPPPSDTVAEHEVEVCDVRRVFRGDTKVFSGELTLPDESPFSLARVGAPGLQWNAELWVETDKKSVKLSAQTLFITAKRLLE